MIFVTCLTETGYEDFASLPQEEFDEIVDDIMAVATVWKPASIDLDERKLREELAGVKTWT